MHAPRSNSSRSGWFEIAVNDLAGCAGENIFYRFFLQYRRAAGLSQPAGAFFESHARRKFVILLTTSATFVNSNN
jgi:hypothetical protein